MKRKLKINGREVDYSLRRRKGVKCLKLSAYPDGYLVVSAPAHYPIFLINRFLKKNTEWIMRCVENIASTFRDDEDRYKMLKNEIYSWVAKKTEEINQLYELTYNKISIRRSRTRWGSCSAKKNISFNYKVYFLEEDLQKYIIVHELCHLQELNHSRKFWELVARAIPDFRDRRKKLREVKI